MTSSSLYNNLPLPPPSASEGPSIRLLTFSNGLWTLEVAPLATSKYKALSYAWGDRYDILPIRCNGTEIQVTRNLYWALQRLSVDFAGQRLWIDAICINQNDEAYAEKGQQLDIMGEIYAQAEEVLIWLSESFLPDNTDLCFEACRKYGTRWRYARLLVTAFRLLEPGNREGGRISDAAVRHSLAIENPFSDDIMAGLFQILRHPYWTRVWVIQEMSLASKSRILTGKSSLDWGDFKIFLIMMEHCLPWYLRGMGPNFRALNGVTRTQRAGEPPALHNLSDLLVEFRWSSATDSRDKVYGLLGLLTANERQFFMAELGDKYLITTTHCYTQFAFKLLQQSQDLGFLVQCSAPSFVKRDKTLPSWVPDWQYDATSLPPPRWGLTEGNPYNRIGDVRPTIYKGYNASGDSQCPPPLLRDSRVLILQGMVVGRIATICRPIEIQHQFLSEKTPKGLLQPWARAPREETLARLWNNVIWKVAFTRSGIYRLAFAHVHNSIRKGAAMEIFLEYSQLALSSGTWLGDKDKRDPLYVMFDTLTKGPRGRDILNPRFTDAAPVDLIEEAVAEFRMQSRSIRWNPFLRLLGLFGFPYYFPSTYQLLLGLNYFGMGKIPPYLWFLLVLYAAMTFSTYYVTVNAYVLIGLGYLVNTKLSSVLSMPYNLETVIGIPLDHALARLDDGRLALVPHDTMVGDEIALLAGGRCPFAVRRVHYNRFELVGDCYVDGIMEGEAWREWEAREMAFV
ncbi:heterokaryon incompatibility protein-domain-containing protein [Apiosordaria backusii]|uniref:Heterokaryon incompatibility protein-domain-containing protein n=1 Tax=Apiosordaria backusii TaxID=314023 RepID=A0AA40BJI1_9PEZI|nr:heterokaryon incompatibility protein-domain-containing protein [Apiosordaria backusii]